jgi:hypothetical protein
MTTRPSYLSTTPDYPPSEDVYYWLPSQHPTFAPSPYLSAEQTLAPVPESPQPQLVPLKTQEGNSVPSEPVLPAPTAAQDKGKGKDI